MLICTMFSAVSQILLKQSANEEHASALREYLNWRVIVAYLIFGSVLLLNTYAYTQVDLKYGPVLDTFTYVFVLLLSFGVLKEKVSKGKLIGNRNVLEVRLRAGDTARRRDRLVEAAVDPAILFDICSETVCVGGI